MKRFLPLLLLALGMAFNAQAQLAGVVRQTNNVWMPGDRKISFGNKPNAYIQYLNGNLVIAVPQGGGTVTFPNGASIGSSSSATTVTIPDNTATAYNVKEGANSYFKVTTTNSSESVIIGNATTNPTVQFLGTGQISAGGSLNVKGAYFDIPDNQNTPFEVAEGSGPAHPYILVQTSNGSENIQIGNATTNPTITVAGSGAMTVAGAFTASTSLKVATGAVIQKILKGTATIDFASTNAQLSRDSSNITVTGAVSGDICTVGAPAASVVANSSYSCHVTAADTAVVRLNNYSSGAVDPASGTFTIAVIHLQ